MPFWYVFLQGSAHDLMWKSSFADTAAGDLRGF